MQHAVLARTRSRTEPRLQAHMHDRAHARAHALQHSLIDDRVESSDDRAVTAAPIVDLDEAEVPTVVAGRTELQ